LTGPETVARLLSRALNEWTATHGRDSDGARAQGNWLTVIHEDHEYEVRVTLRPHAPGYRAELHRTCGKLACNDSEHLVVRPAPDQISSIEEG